MSGTAPITTVSGAGVPIVITTASTGGLFNGESVTITGVNGNTAANGTFFLGSLTPTTFELYSDAAQTMPVNGIAAYTAGGTWAVAPGTVTVAADSSDTIFTISFFGNLAGNNTTANLATVNITSVDGATAAATANPPGGALIATSGTATWAGPITLSGPATIGANGTQSLQNGVAPAQLTIVGTINDEPGIDTQFIAFTNPSAGSTQFTVTFNGATTGTLTYTGVAATDTANIQNALNGLTSIGGLLPTAGSVTVTANGADTVFEIAFGGSLSGSNQPLASVNIMAGTLATAVVTPAGSQVITFTNEIVNSTKFTLTFNGATTAKLTYTGVAATDVANIQTALNGLATIGGLLPIAGAVTVTANASDTVFTVTFSGSLSGSSQPPVAAGIVAGTPGDVVVTQTASINTLTKTGFGNVILAGVNEYGGQTIVQQGALIIDNPDALSGINTLVTAGTALELESSLNLEPVTLNGEGIPFDGHNTGAPAQHQQRQHLHRHDHPGHELDHRGRFRQQPDHRQQRRQRHHHRQRHRLRPRQGVNRHADLRRPE